MPVTRQSTYQKTSNAISNLLASLKDFSDGRFPFPVVFGLHFLFALASLSKLFYRIPKEFLAVKE
jgi:hypothetical protein